MCCGMRFIWGRMGRRGAFEALSSTGNGQGLMMPIHWGLFDLALHAWRQPIERCLELAGEKRIKIWLRSRGGRRRWWRGWRCGRIGGATGNNLAEEAGCISRFACLREGQPQSMIFAVVCF